MPLVLIPAPRLPATLPAPTLPTADSSRRVALLFGDRDDVFRLTRRSAVNDLGTLPGRLEKYHPKSEDDRQDDRYQLTPRRHLYHGYRSD